MAELKRSPKNVFSFEVHFRLWWGETAAHYGILPCLWGSSPAACFPPAYVLLPHCSATMQVGPWSQSSRLMLWALLARMVQAIQAFGSRHFCGHRNWFRRKGLMELLRKVLSLLLDSMPPRCEARSCCSHLTPTRSGRFCCSWATELNQPFLAFLTWTVQSDSH